jgi:hypothetical protein
LEPIHEISVMLAGEAAAVDAWCAYVSEAVVMHAAYGGELPAVADGSSSGSDENPFFTTASASTAPA